MKANLFDLTGKQVGEVELPAQFNEFYRVDLIRRCFHAEFTARLQPKGSFPLAGLQTTAAYYGRRHAWRQTINTGRSRLPREKIPGGHSGRVLRVPHAVKGRRAHPPKAAKNLVERINLKEKNKAICSALSASANANLVKARGHLVDGKSLVVVDNSFEAVKKASQAKGILEKLGLTNDLLRAKNARKLRSGRARLRKGGYRTPKSVLIVYGKDEGVWRAARNLPGVDVISVSSITIEKLAPGGVAGRPLVITQNALKELGEKKLYL